MPCDGNWASSLPSSLTLTVISFRWQPAVAFPPPLIPPCLYYRRNTLNTHAFTHTPLTTRPHTHFRPNCAQFTTLLLASYSHIAIFLPANSNSSSAHWLHDICLACVPIVPVVRLANCARIVVWMCVFHAPLAAHTVSGSVTINQWIKIK